MSKLFTSRVNTGAVNFAVLVLRVVFGAAMFTHGLSKLKGFSGMVNKFPDPLHVGQTISLSLTIFAETLCAGLVVIGLLTRLAAIPLVFCMIIVVFVVM